MVGIQFLTDEKGRKTGVLIDLKKHKDLWEDFYDHMTCEARKNEKTVPYEKVKEGLRKRGKLPRD